MSHIQSLNGRLFALIWACVRHLSSGKLSGAPADGGRRQAPTADCVAPLLGLLEKSFIGPCTTADTHTQHVVHSSAVSTAAGL